MLWLIIMGAKSGIPWLPPPDVAGIGDEGLFRAVGVNIATALNDQRSKRVNACSRHLPRLGREYDTVWLG
jgi:hypothetical protein